MSADFPKRSQRCISGCSGTVFTLPIYNIKTNSYGCNFPLEVNHVKSVCCVTIHVTVLYLSVIYYSLHEPDYQLMNE